MIPLHILSFDYSNWRARESILIAAAIGSNCVVGMFKRYFRCFLRLSAGPLVCHTCYFAYKLSQLTLTERIGQHNGYAKLPISGLGQLHVSGAD